jgi:hypothetical protein
VARTTEETLDSGCEDALRARADLVMLLTRAVLTPADICKAFDVPPLERTIQLDIVNAGRMSHSRARVYSALFADVREWLTYAQDEAAEEKLTTTKLAVKKAMETLRPWLLAPDKATLHWSEFQDARTALSVYLVALRATARDYLPRIDEAVAEADERRAVRPPRFAHERLRKEQARLAAALALREQTQVSVRQLLRSHDVPAKRRSRAPLSNGEAAIAFWIYGSRLDAPMPTPQSEIDALTTPEARKTWLRPPAKKG